MKYTELKKLKPYRITKKSSDGTFVPDEVIWISEGGEINSVHGGGSIYPDEGYSATWDFEAEEAHGWEVISISGHEYCRKLEQKKMTNLEKLGYSKDKTVDEVAVDMLIERIKDYVDRKSFNTNWRYGVYVKLYKSMKEWLESEAEE